MRLCTSILEMAVGCAYWRRCANWSEYGTLISKLKRRNKLIKVADRSLGAGPQSVNTRSLACVEVIQRTIES